MNVPDVVPTKPCFWRKGFQLCCGLSFHQHYLVASYHIFYSYLWLFRWRMLSKMAKKILLIKHPYHKAANNDWRWKSSLDHDVFCNSLFQSFFVDAWMHRPLGKNNATWLRPNDRKNNEVMSGRQAWVGSLGLLVLGTPEHQSTSQPIKLS